MPDPSGADGMIDRTPKPFSPLDPNSIPTSTNSVKGDLSVKKEELLASSAGLVPISAERLQKLEELEAALPGMIELAIAEYKKSNLKRLHEKDKTDPESVKLRVYRYVQKHKDKINERRREKRKEKKEAAAAAVAAAAAAAYVSSNQEGVVTRTFYANEKEQIDRGGGGSAELSFPRLGADGVTVRFDE